MSIKEIVRFKQGSHIIGLMYRIAELAKREKKANSRLASSK